MEYNYITMNDRSGVLNIFKLVGETKLYYKVKMNNAAIVYVNKKTMKEKGSNDPWSTFYYELVSDKEGEDIITRINKIRFLKGFVSWGHLNTDVLVKIVGLIRKDMEKK